jgi:very-short-patch-repair endonuclease
MELGSWLAQQGGIAHSAQAVRAGFTRYAIRQGIDDGGCTRIRRDWLALPTAPVELCAAAALEHVTVAALGRLHLRSAAARAVRDVASGVADSGLETLPVARLAAIGIPVRQQVWLEGHRVDGLIGRRLVLQTDGFSFHSTAVQRREDIAHDRRLALLGYTVLRYDYRQILSDWPRVEAEILLAMAQGLHLGPQIRK